MKRVMPILVTAVVSLGVGALAVALLVRGGLLSLLPSGTATEPMTAPSSVAIPATGAPVASEVIVSIPADALERIHLSYARVTEETVFMDLRVPGTVQPNAYGEVRVTSLIGGVVRRVSAELGQSVKSGQPLATVFSRELAEAQTEFLNFQAQLEAEHKKLVRTQELLGLGAASAQEMEEVQASHQVHMAHVEEARQRLLLLGLNESQVEEVRAGHIVSSEISIPSPSDGIVTARILNVGQVVSPGQEMFTVTDLSAVWIEANVLEDDFGAVRKGVRATITTLASPSRTYQGTVDYVDPRVDPQTRTAKARVVVENRDLSLRLGMYADVHFAHSGARAAVVPPQAVQVVGTSTVVYVPIDGRPGQFRQVAVTAGSRTTTERQIVGDIQPGQQVVTDGSFLLRAEAIRQSAQ